MPTLLSLLFLTDRRVRRDRRGGLIGSVLPLISSVPVVDPDAAERSGHGLAYAGAGSLVQSIQSIRAVLEGRMARGEGAFALTGVGGGSGTTSAAVGLASSVALSGNKVLLIDLAWLQKPSGQGNDDQATRNGLGIDGVIEELGYLEDEDREALLLADDEAGVGFAALLSGKSLRRSIIETRVDGLNVLSAMGRAEKLREQWAGRVSSRWLSKLLEVARRGGYDAVLIDAGSAAGSVEGMLGCAAADAVVIVVSNDQTQAEYQKAVGRLQIVGATVIGTVLNRSGARRRHASADVSLSRKSASPGRTAGSGIFAAALEARTGGEQPTTGHAPLPHDDPAGPQNRPESPLAAPADGSVDSKPDTLETLAAALASPPAAAAPAIPPGVDPFDEPPAEATPTPLRLAPRKRAVTPGDVPLPSALDQIRSEASRNPESLEELLNRPPQRSDADADDSSSTRDALDRAIDIHVADDVMDQLVDHAIRNARRPERPPTVPSPAVTAADDDQGGSESESLSESDSERETQASLQSAEADPSAGR